MSKFPATIFIFTFLLMQFQTSAQSSYKEEIKTAAVKLIQSFDLLQKKAGLLSFSDTARIKWNNLPVGLRARDRVSIGNMTEEQRRSLHRILSASLSSQGYLKSTGIMHLDNLLNMWVDSAFSRKLIDENLRKFLFDLQWSHKIITSHSLVRLLILIGDIK